VHLRQKLQGSSAKRRKRKKDKRVLVMRLLSLSDIHGHINALPALLEKESRQGLDCIIVCGDLTQLGGYNEARDVMKPFLESGHVVYALQGNMDLDGVGRFLAESGIGIHGKTVAYKGISITGLGGGNISPFNTPTEFTESEMNGILTASEPGRLGLKTKILVSHTPPFETNLDRLRNGTHVGSSAVKAFIIKEKMNICVSGHIHESAGVDRIGECTCANAGPFVNGNYLIIELDPATGKSSIEIRKVEDK
jgi:uncharacterized protein